MEDIAYPHWIKTQVRLYEEPHINTPGRANKSFNNNLPCHRFPARRRKDRIVYITMHTVLTIEKPK